MSAPRRSVLDGATLVFDLDGTLVDTAPDLVGTLNFLLAEDGAAPLPLAAARPMIGRGARALIAQGFAAAGRPADDGKLNALFDRFIDHYRGRIADESRAFPGLEAALDDLAAAGAILAVCTNKRTGLSKELLEALGLKDRFAAIVGADLAPAPKPDPVHYVTAVQQARGDLQRSLMVGDSVSDARAARGAGVPLILVSFGYTETPVQELGGDIVIDDFQALRGACEALLT